MGPADDRLVVWDRPCTHPAHRRNPVSEASIHYPDWCSARSFRAGQAKEQWHLFKRWPRRPGALFWLWVDTLLVCFSTGMVVLVTGAWKLGETGGAMSARAFEIGMPGGWGSTVVSISLILFAFSTLIGWSFYGESGIVYLFGPGAIMPYRLVWIATVYIGAVGSLPLVWEIADTFDGLMAIPNLVGVLLSAPLLGKLVREFFAAKQPVRDTVAEAQSG